ncbi:polysaccharide deacetylase family protein [Methylomonas sp. HYX-M1]|uniref:polysaccharide deacetylase family protein n=1 Tax=Methylomonas sp. HYX-M1 TaxID=3139307 RepID=UPI00345BDDC0
MINDLILKLMRPFAALASGAGKQKKLIILIYHRVLDKPDYMRSDEIDKAAFSWQMELLAKHFTVLSLPDAIERLQQGSLPSRAVCVTFDDGYADNYNNAFPILKSFGLSATFFVASGFLNGGRMWNDTIIEAIRCFPNNVLDLQSLDLGVYQLNSEKERYDAAQTIIRKIKHLDFVKRKQYCDLIGEKCGDLPNDLMMTNDQVVELSKNGMDIGGHTVNHPILAKLDSDQAKMEINDNKRYLEWLLNREISLFAYPNGKPELDYTNADVDIVKNANYKAAVSTASATADRKSDIWQLPRLMPWDKSPIPFMARMICFYQKGGL